MAIQNGLVFCLLASALLLLLLLYTAGAPSGAALEDTCHGRRIFVYDLPERFNHELIRRCNSKLVSWLDFCQHVSNDGLGLPVRETELGEGWYGTDSYMLEVIFHSRIRSYPCLTNVSSRADALFLPYYAGLDALQYLYNSGADRSLHGAELLDWMSKHAGAELQKKGGRDHILVMGRTSWDFQSVGDSAWGTSILDFPRFSNMSLLFLERNPWRRNQYAVPYPTSFHPRSLRQLEDWSDRAGASERRYLFSFAGAMRPEQGESIRSLLLKQCLGSENCSFVDCGRLRCGHNPAPIVTTFLRSQFCLQPRGDSSTRRSAFDAIVSGCIPVFFHRDSAYSQYSWHLPEDPESFSVLIEEDDVRDGTLVVEDVLRGFSLGKILEMRAALVKMIPRVIYMHGNVGEVEDAFDISIEKAIKQIKS